MCCGHLFCKSCLDSVKKAALTSNVCPICRDEEFVTYPQKQANREIKELHVYCTNKEKGCEWQGELNGINNHLGNSDGCQFEEVNCSNECEKMIERRYLTSHVETECPCRDTNCQYCHDTGEHQFIEGQHKEECPKLPLPCPNKCEVGSVPREDMEAHRKECPLEMIQCEYHNVGCEVSMVREDMEKHNNQTVKEHLQLTTHKLSAMEDQLATALKQISNLTILMHSQFDLTANAGAMCNISVIKWSIKLNAMVSMFKSGNLVLPATVKMSGYSKMEENDKEWYSDPFYTHIKGYKMCLTTNAAGDGGGRGTHLSVFLILTKGSHDDELIWPLRGKFEIKLLNQISDSEHHSVTVTYDDNTDGPGNRVMEGDISEDGWGRPQFISNEDLCDSTPTCQYLSDDCLFFQASSCSK